MSTVLLELLRYNNVIGLMKNTLSLARIRSFQIIVGFVDVSWTVNLKLDYWVS